MKTKIKKIQLLRHLVQLVSFFLLPGFFILVFGEMKNVVQTIANGNSGLFRLLPVSMEMLLALALTLILGRFFCGWICAFGTFNDFIYYISKKMFKHKFRISEKLDSYMKYLKYVVLGIIIVFSWILGNLVFHSVNPWDAFAMLPDVRLAASDYLFGLVLLLFLTAGAALIERFFCRYLCPLGAIFAIVSKLSIFSIDKPKDECGTSNGRCRVCTNHCSMGIPMYQQNEVRGGECINCLSCTEVCPSKNAKAAMITLRLPATIAVFIALTAVFGLYVANNAAATSTFAIDAVPNYSTGHSNPTTDTMASDSPTINIQDPYSTENETGAQNNNNHQGSSKSGTAPIQEPASKSTDNQSASVTPTSGTTTDGTAGGNSSSVTNPTAAAIVDTATAKPALKASATIKSNPTPKPTIKSTATATTTPNATATPKPTIKATATPKPIATTKYKDGTYEGSGIGFRNGITTVSVTIKNDKLTNIETISSEDTPRWYDRVEFTMFDEILSGQSTHVDIISGATYSCYGIMDAVQDALNKAAKANSN